MNITRNNYETFFLLYADGELSPGEMQEVDQFVSNHPDLSGELDLLLETVLEKASPHMPNKHLLLKPEIWEEPTLSPQQHDLLLLLDNELPATKVLELHSQIVSDPLLLEDWQTLLNSKLEAPAIEMAGKETLYRKASQTTPIPLQWVKWLAAAAVVTGFGWFALSTRTGNQPTVPETSITANQPVNNKQVIIDNHPSTPIASSDKVTEPAINNAGSINSKPINPAEVVSNPTIKTPAIVLTTPVQAKGKTGTYVLPETSPKPVVEKQPLVDLVIEKQIPATKRALLEMDEFNNPIAIHSTGQEGDIHMEPGEQEIEFENDFADTGEYVTIAGARIKKQKLRGVFRSVSRTVTRTFEKSNIADANHTSL